ncbi:hypothetical protein M9H77_32615 [Catharanthus roseus]|uniref:Uncharacterized protein n=1 Tax=Catharanthus roseus TaxID=4058 RepID=A0ACC0A5X6_CATRO|nr:hypothetical protein M9H77_32615 [Catharanthus roseus]
MLRPQVIRPVHDDPLISLGLPIHTIVTYRNQLDFIHLISLVPSDLWQAEVPLICYEIVEYHFFGRRSTLDGIGTSPECTLEIQQIVIPGPPSSPAHVASFAKKVQTIIRRLKRGARRLLGHGARGGRPPLPPFLGRHKHADPGHEVERGEGSGRRGHVGASHPIDPFNSPDLYRPSFSLSLTLPSQSLPGGSETLHAPSPPGLGFAPFKSPHHTSLGFLSFHAPLTPDTTDSSTSHQPISHASSSDEEERTDDTTHVQHLGFGYRVGKKITRFKLSDWP